MQTVVWLRTHLGDLLQGASLLGLFFTVYTLRQDAKERKIQNLFAVTAGHREIWSKVYDKPELARILQTDIDLDEDPPSFQERLFVQLLILHLSSSFQAREAGMDFGGDAIEADIRQFFARPIPSAVWERSREFQSPDFVRFVERAMEE